MVLALLARTHPCLAQPSPVIDPKPVATDHQMLHKYVWSTLGVEGALSATVGSAIDQWRNSGVAGWRSDWPRRIVRHMVSGSIGHT